MKTELRDRGVLLTGASSGIGRATASAMGKHGARLALAARTESALHELADEIVAAGGHPPTVIRADLSARGAAAEVAVRATEALGEVEILVNNAGGGVGGSQWAVADGDPAREALRGEPLVPARADCALVPRMRERGSGAVVNVTSAAQTGTWPCFGTYAATKAAFALATESLRLELDGSDVRVLEVIPGPVSTAVESETRPIPGIEHMLKPLGMGTPGRAAELIVDAIARGRTRVVYPRPVLVGLALPALSRRRTRRLVARHFTTLPATDREAILSLAVRSGSAGDEASRAARAEWAKAQL